MSRASPETTKLRPQAENDWGRGRHSGRWSRTPTRQYAPTALWPLSGPEDGRPRERVVAQRLLSSTAAGRGSRGLASAPSALIIRNQKGEPPAAAPRGHR